MLHSPMCFWNPFTCHMLGVWGEETALLSDRSCIKWLHRWSIKRITAGIWGSLLRLWSCVHGHSYVTTRKLYHHNYNQLLNKNKRQFGYKYCYQGRLESFANNVNLTSYNTIYNLVWSLCFGSRAVNLGKGDAGTERPSVALGSQ